MLTRINLNYTSFLPETPVSELTFNTPNLALINQNKRYLRATSPDANSPILFTSDNPAIAEVKLEDNFWSVEFKGIGTVTLTASQGSSAVNRTVTIIGHEESSGRVINVGNGEGEIIINETLDLMPGDRVIIAPGSYSLVSIENIKIPDGQAPVSIESNGLVEVSGDFSYFNFKHLRNVIIDGGKSSGSKYGFLCRDNIYHGVYLEDINYITIKNLELKNIYNSGWHWEGMNVAYDGSESSYQKGNCFINIKSDNAGGFGTGGYLDVDNEPQIMGLVEGLTFENWEIENSSTGSMIYVGCGQNILFKNIHINHANTINNNHNGLLFCSGTADVINCSVKNSQGNLIRLWTWTLIDGNIKGRSTPKKCLLYGNTYSMSRKYSFFETQSFDRYIVPGLTSFSDVDIFHNTGANLNQNIPVVFSGTLLDNYYLQGGTVRCFNNVLINPVNEGSNNIFFTYSSSAVGGTETQVGETQEFNNQVFYSMESSGLNACSLAPGDSAVGLRGAISNSSTNLYLGDYYGNTKVGYVGAIQAKEMKIATQSAPSIPDISEWFDSYDDNSAEGFQVNAKRSVAALGIKNYDVERNSLVMTTLGGYCRDGKPDPEIESDFSPGELIQWRFAARDFRDQVSEWSPRFVHLMPGGSYASVPLELTRTSGGTLVNNGNVYETTGDIVFCSTGISLGPDESVRVVFDNVSETGAFLPYVGWAETAAITTVGQIRAGVRSDSEQITKAFVVKDGQERSVEYFNEGHTSLSLYIHYDGYSWFKVSSDELKWYNIGTQRNKNTQIIDDLYLGTKFLVIAIPLGSKLSNPRLIVYPSFSSDL